MKIINQLLFLTVVFCAFQSGWTQSAGDAETDITPTHQKSNPVDSTWTDYFFSKEDCKCVYGEEFFVSLRENTPDRSNLIITLQGGGACWPGMPHCKPEVTPGDIEDVGVQLSTGINKASGNTWNQALIPYCDGSVYLGTTNADYDQDGETDHWHWGKRNAIGGINLIHNKFPNLKKIVINGCSAGGYGTFTMTQTIQKFYPNAEIWVINESGQGFLTQSEATLAKIDAAWNLDPNLPTEVCKDHPRELIYNYVNLLEHPKTRIVLYSSYYDEVVGQQFLDYTPEEFKEKLMFATDHIKEHHPKQFFRFFIDGNSHCISDRSYKVNDTVYMDWLLSFLDNEEKLEEVFEADTSGR